MHSKKGEDKKKGDHQSFLLFFFFFCGQAKLLYSPSSTNEYLYKPTEFPFTKRNGRLYQHLFYNRNHQQKFSSVWGGHLIEQFQIRGSNL